MKYLSLAFILIGISTLLFIFGPVLKEEIKYQTDQKTHVTYSLDAIGQGTFEKKLTPPNTDFSIVIPAIGAVAPVIENVDAGNPKKYLSALRQGVAHAAGTTLPYDNGNMFLFAHSSDSFYSLNTYNAIFYLIGKLRPGDEVNIFYNDKLFKYEVYDKKVVSSDSSQYFGTLIEGEKTLTLQTCYPPGTALKRLVVLAKQVE
jgi:LPXTG-site transpeptidase (sortase) family protein